MGQMIISTFERSKKHESPPHSHENGQFVFVESGVLHLRSTHGAWIVPKEHLGWIPKDEVHNAQALSDVKGWTILTNQKFEDILPKKICTIKTTPLLTALLDRIVHTNDNEEFKAKAFDLIFEELKNIETEKLQIPLPLSPNLASIAQDVLDDLGQIKRIEEWAALAGTSKRTFTRHFLLETGMTFDEWRKNAIGLKAVELLSQGRQVSDIAFDLGYESVSAFIAMFKKHFGKTPTHFFRNIQDYDPDL